MKAAIIDIPNMRQRANGLCWAAAAAPAVTYFTGRSISQHQLCAAAGRRPGDGATIQDMARAIANAASLRTYHTLRLSAEATFTYLNNGRPLLLLVDVGEGFVAHCVCLRGLIFDGAWHAIINEPNLAYSVFVPFARIQAAWLEGLVILGRS